MSTMSARSFTRPAYRWGREVDLSLTVPSSYQNEWRSKVISTAAWRNDRMPLVVDSQHLREKAWERVRTFLRGKETAMKRVYKIVFPVLLLIVVNFTIASYPSVYAASSSSSAAKLQGGSVHLSGGAGQNVHVADSSQTRVVSKSTIVHHDSAPCFDVSITVQKTGTGTNTFAVHGLATFFCHNMSGGGIEVNTTVLCPGVGTASQSTFAPFPSGKIFGNSTWSYLSNFTGVCELCTNHVPTAFPFFTVDAFTTATTFRPLPGTPVSDPSSYTDPVEGTSTIVNTGFQNSSSFTVPC